MGVYRSQELAFGVESAFAEAVNTLDTRINFLDPPTWSYPEERRPDPSGRSRMNEVSISHRGAHGPGTLTFRTYAIGALAATNGSLIETWQIKLMRYGLGGGNTSQVGGTVNTPSSASQFTGTGTTFVNGAAARVGTWGTRAGGQAGIVNALAGTSFLTAFPAQPNAGDPVYACQMAHHSETAALAGLTTLRWLVSHAETGAQYMLRGAQLAGLVVTWDYQGGNIMIDWTYNYAQADQITDATPSARTPEDHDCAPASAGSVFFQDFGTATRSTLTPAEASLALDLGLVPRFGPGGVGARQIVVGWQRTRCIPMVSMAVPYSEAAAILTWWNTSNASINHKHLLVTLVSDNGERACGFYMPRVFPIGPAPVVPVEINEQMYIRFSVLGTESTDTDSEIERSSWRWFAG